MSKLLTWFLTCWLLHTCPNHKWWKSKLNHGDARDAVEEVVDKKEESPPANHWLLADHIVQPLLVTQYMGPHKAVDECDEGLWVQDLNRNLWNKRPE